MAENATVYECPLLYDLYSLEKRASFAMGAWVWQKHPWHTFVTLTYEDVEGRPPGIVRCRHTISDYTCLFGAHEDASIFVLEAGSMSNRLHWHGLLTDYPESVKPWRYGHYRIEEVRSEKAGYYISKYVVKNYSDIVYCAPWQF